MTRRLVLVTRKGCHLCDEALGELQRLGYEPAIADVDSDDSLFALYDWRVPVLLLDGDVIAEGKIDGAMLTRALGKTGRDRPA